jgi:molecular chaperone GrpE (heat shock protein)
MFKVGDYVRHVRQGAGRIVEVLPDQILIKQRSGNMLKVNLGIAEHELESCPPDGFVAQLVHRDYSAEALQTHIEDVLIRILRDKRRRSISIADLKDILMPFLDREERKWTSWWKSTRKHLRSNSISINTKRKLVERLDTEVPIAVEYDIASPVELLSAARELSSREGEDSAITQANAAATRALELSSTITGEDRPRAELLLAACYLCEATKSEQADRLRVWLSKQDLATLTKFRDLDADVVVCLPLIAKVAPGQTALTVLGLLSHPTTTVAQKAFSILNTERNRHLLRESFLRWLHNSGGPELPGLDFYLQSEFLRNVRKDDIVHLYRKLLSLSPPPTAVRQFLNREEVITILVASSALDQAFIAALLNSAVLSADVKGKIAERAAGSTQVLNQLLSDGGLKSGSAVLSYLPQISAPELLSQWSSLLLFLRQSGSEDEVNAAAVRIADLLDSSSPEVEHSLVAAASDLWNLAADRQQELPCLCRAVERIVGRLSSEEVDQPKSLLGGAIARALRERLSTIQREIDSIKVVNKGLRDDLCAAEKESTRLRKLAEMLKSSGSTESEESKILGKREVLMPLLSFCDDLERRRSAPDGDKLTAYLTELENVLARAGVRRIGNPGGEAEFDPASHEATETAIESGTTVLIIRAGYAIGTQNGIVLLRRALVKRSH